MTLAIFTPTTTVQLTPSQGKVKQELYQAIKQGHERILVVAPCAWGKTIFASSIIADAVSKKKKCLFIVHAEVLIAQTLNALSKFGLNTGVIAGAYKENRTADVQVATVQALAARTKKGLDAWFTPDVVIVDEAHDQSMWSTWTQQKFPKLSKGQVQKDNNFLLPYLEKIGINSVELTWQEIQKAHKKASIHAHPDHGGTDEAMKIINLAWEEIKKHKARFNPDPTAKPRSFHAYNAVLIGLTGSPYRLKKTENMGDFFQAQVLAPTPRQMVEEGYLTPCVYYGMPKINTPGVRGNSLGDFNTADLTLQAIKITKNLVDNYKKICPDRTFICFACSIYHAEMLVKEFTDNDIKVKIVTGDTDPKKERPLIYNELKTKQIQGIVSVDCLTTGFDVTSISCVLLARPTKSFALYIQMIGRAMRLHEGKENCYILDQSGNVSKFGFIENIAYPPLHKGREVVKDDRQKGSNVKECPSCHALLPSNASYCPHCGHMSVERKKMVLDNMVLLLTKKQIPIYNFYRGKIAELYAHRKNPGYAVYLTQTKFKSKDMSIPLWIPKEWAKGAIFGNEPKEEHRAMYQSFLTQYAHEYLKDTAWVNKLMSLEFGDSKKKTK